MFGIFGAFFRSNVLDLFFLIKSSCKSRTANLCNKNLLKKVAYKINPKNGLDVELFICLNRFYITTFIPATVWQELSEEKLSR